METGFTFLARAFRDDFDIAVVWAIMLERAPRRVGSAVLGV